MRKKPITRDQVRVHHYEVWTLPYGSFHGRHHRDRAKALRPIERLWKPLLDQLHRQEREWWNSGPATKPELWGEFESCVSVAYPSVPSTCRHCGRRFFHGYRRRSKWCSDLCAEQRALPALRRRSKRGRKRVRKPAPVAPARPAVSPSERSAPPSNTAPSVAGWLPFARAPDGAARPPRRGPATRRGAALSISAHGRARLPRPGCFPSQWLGSG